MQFQALTKVDFYGYAGASNEAVIARFGSAELLYDPNSEGCNSTGPALQLFVYCEQGDDTYTTFWHKPADDRTDADVELGYLEAVLGKGEWTHRDTAHLVQLGWTCGGEM